MNSTPLPRQFALDISHIPSPSLDNFLPGQDLALISTLRDLASSWKDISQIKTHALNQRWMYWWGSEGSGRTHLLDALSHSAKKLQLQCFQLRPEEPLSWVRLEEVMGDLANQEQASVITVDDVDHVDERLAAALFRILNTVHSSKAIYIFMAGNAAPQTLRMREDLRTRLGWGLVFQTHSLTDNEKIQALHEAAVARGLVLSSDVLPWLLNHFYRDMTNLMALMDALDAYSLETKRAVTLPLVRELLQPK